MSEINEQGEFTLQDRQPPPIPDQQVVKLDHLFKAPLRLPSAVWLRPCDAWLIGLFDAVDRVAGAAVADLPAAVTIDHDTDQGFTFAEMQIGIACATITITSHTGMDAMQWSGTLNVRSACCNLPTWSDITGEASFTAALALVLSNLGDEHGEPPSEYWRWNGDGRNPDEWVDWSVEEEKEEFEQASTLVVSHEALAEFLIANSVPSWALARAVVVSTAIHRDQVPDADLVLRVVATRWGQEFRLDPGNGSTLRFRQTHGEIEVNATRSCGHGGETVWIHADVDAVDHTVIPPVSAWLQEIVEVTA